MTPPKPFLTARWEHLVMLNFPVPTTWLEPLVPRGTELDLWQDRALVSLVAFQFLDTRLGGWPIPWHRHFPEVNLRFYVRRLTPQGPRRAVVFIRELVPRYFIAAVARWLYNEPYWSLAMSFDVALDPERGGHLRYRWRHRRGDYAVAAEVEGPALPLVAGSEAEFLTEHYWGYTRQRDGGTLEYQVEHPPWRVWTPKSATFTGPPASLCLYGKDFGEVLRTPPASALVAVGSPVAVHVGRRLP